MRIDYPDDIDKEIDEIMPFLVLEGHLRVVRPDAPEEIAERYEALVMRMHEFEESCR